MKKKDSLNGHEYVDLGLPSGLLWATCNVGSDTPEGYGDYFAWGETAPKDTYTRETYRYAAEGSSWQAPRLTKYCGNAEQASADFTDILTAAVRKAIIPSFGNAGFSDTLTTLEASDDAATSNWGAGWRMPTSIEMKELCDNCTQEWTTQNGVNGRKFTGPNGNSIFLPAAGAHDGTNLDIAGSYGLYWSSSLDTDYPDGALFFNFHSGNCSVITGNRLAGLAVRPVCVR